MIPAGANARRRMGDSRFCPDGSTQGPRSPLQAGFLGLCCLLNGFDEAIHKLRAERRLDAVALICQRRGAARAVSDERSGRSELPRKSSHSVFALLPRQQSRAGSRKVLQHQSPYCMNGFGSVVCWSPGCCAGGVIVAGIGQLVATCTQSPGSRRRTPSREDPGQEVARMDSKHDRDAFTRTNRG